MRKPKDILVPAGEVLEILSDHKGGTFLGTGLLGRIQEPVIYIMISSMKPQEELWERLLKI